MKLPAAGTLLLVTAERVARADFQDGLHASKTAARPVGSSLVEAIRAALALAGKPGSVWVLSTEVFTQRISLSPAQVAGLTPEQLARALSFEVEPFSGLPVAESVTGFLRNGDGAFDVIELSRTERDAIQRAAVEAGGKLAGITHPGTPPDDDEALLAWWIQWPARLASGAVPLITPTAPEPSPHRFLITGVALEAAALLFLLTAGGWMAYQRKGLESRQLEFAAINRELEAATKQNTALQTELAAFDKEQTQRDRLVARRGAILALLNGLAATRPEDVVVRGIESDGPSSLIVSGISLEADAVDEMSIVLTQKLRASGWTAQPRSKVGKRRLPSGGPWEFSLTLTHDEAAPAQGIRLTQRGDE